MGTFKIEGGHRLKGEIHPQGAKNEALQILCTVLLTSEKVTINNIPDIIDVNKLITLLGNLGVKMKKMARALSLFKQTTSMLAILKPKLLKKKVVRYVVPL
jgi:UDP-N-acetylglucosamine 1-carboxyvinyltransferase